MAGNNSLTLNIVAKVQDQLIGKLESKMKTVISTAKKLETATGKGFDKLKTINVRGIENLNNKIKPLITGMAGLSVKLLFPAILFILLSKSIIRLYPL